MVQSFLVKHGFSTGTTNSKRAKASTSIPSSNIKKRKVDLKVDDHGQELSHLITTTPFVVPRVWIEQLGSTELML